MTTARAEVALLTRHVGRTVRAEALFTGETRLRHEDGVTLSLLREVLVYPFADVAHLWVALDAAARNRVRADERFSFTATVVAYVRADGHAGVTLGNVKVR